MVIGGWSRSTGILSGIPTASCEIIDVRKREITDGPSMNVDRTAFQVVDAPDGSFYAVGGNTSSGLTGSVERYDHDRGAWQYVGDLNVPRFQHVATFISPDEILVAGGWGMRSAEIFNVKTGRSRTIADFPYTANSLVAINVLDKRPALYGGRVSGPQSSVSQLAYAYDPDRDVWDAVYDLTDVAVRPSTITLSNGHALVVGGVNTESPFVTFRSIRTVAPNGNIKFVGNLIEGRQWHGLGQWTNGRVLCAGGTVNGPVPVATCELIDPETGMIERAPSMNVRHSFMPMISFMEDGTRYALVVSGLTDNWVGTPVVEMLVEGCATGDRPIANQRAQFVGNALRAGNDVQLTPAQEFARGAMWAREKVDMRAPFASMFAFRITAGDDQGEIEEVPSEPGADGVVFVIQNQGDNVIGNYGRGIGYDGIKRSVAIEIDTYHNGTINDPNGNHMAIQSKGRGENTSTHGTGATLAFSSAMPVIKGDGTTYYCFIQYQQGRLDAYLNTEPSFRAPVVSKYVDLDSLIGLDPDGKAWVGITSGTGRSFEQHDILMWEINGCATDSPVSVNDDGVTPGVPDIAFSIVGHNVVFAEAPSASHRIDVYDARGTLVWTATPTSSVHSLPSSSLANGWYMVRVTSSRGMSVQPWTVMR